MRLALSTVILCSVVGGTLYAQAGPVLSETTRSFVLVDNPVVALTNVRIVDGTGAPPAEGQTLIIRDGKIGAVGPAGQVPIPEAARVMDLAGHTVIPGMFGLHNHTFYTTAAGRRAQLNVSAPRLYLASGITSIRTTGAVSPYSEISLRAAIDRGEIPGPRMHITGPYITGPDNQVHRAHVSTPEGARRVVAYWSEEGVPWFKVYAGISRRELEAVVDEAHKRGVKVTGHLCSVTFPEAVRLGIDNLEHGFLTNSEYDAAKVPDVCPANMRTNLVSVDVQSERVQSTIRTLVENDVPLTSTLAVYEHNVPNRPPLEQRVLDALLPAAKEEYLTARAHIAGMAETSPMPELFEKAMEFEVAFVRAGGLLAAGVDPTGIGGALPGFGDQRNFELLVEAGFTGVEAVQIMSANGARVLGEIDRLGTITPGKLADVVVIEGNPILFPSAIKRVTIVFKDGVGYDSPKLIDSVKGLVGLR